MHDNMLSAVAYNNLLTMGIAAKMDPRQAIPESIQMPDAASRVLRARLIMEEALECCAALGVTLEGSEACNKIPIEGGSEITFDDIVFRAFDDSGNRPPCYWPSMEQIIDACHDTIYVCVGTLMRCGVPDMPGALAVNAANKAKFPKGQALTDTNGKFQKPPGWKPPNHIEVLKNLPYYPNLKVISDAMVNAAQSE